jgi:uncharacterized protein YjbI with pentapeptide repeats
MNLSNGDCRVRNHWRIAHPGIPPNLMAAQPGLEGTDLFLANLQKSDLGGAESSGAVLLFVIARN